MLFFFFLKEKLHHISSEMSSLKIIVTLDFIITENFGNGFSKLVPFFSILQLQPDVV